jgi:hypothetical protein
LLSFGIFLWVKLLFVLKFALDELVIGLKRSCFGHDLSHDTEIGLPFFFIFLLVVLPEEIVGSKNWKSDVGGCAIGDACAYQVMRKAVDHACAWALEVTVDLMDPWLHREETHESTALEFDHVLTICSASFDIDN